VGAATPIYTRIVIYISSTRRLTNRHGNKAIYKIIDHVTNNVKRHTTMAIFSDLPLELRLKIWKMVPVSRNVVLSPHPDGFIKIRTQLFAVWHVCSEARTATLRAYTEIDCSQVVSQTKIMSIYIDFHFDRILFKTGFDGSSRLSSFEVFERFLGEYLGRI
jgi:hypothetical protein